MDISKADKLRDLIGYFLCDYNQSCEITSEGYPHGSYIESSDDSIIIELIDEVNKLLGNPVNLSSLLDH